MDGASGGALKGAPAYAVVLLVLGAAVYSFSHRPLPPFPPTEIHADRLLINGLALQGSRIVAAGELGHILYADSPDGPWIEAKIDKDRGSTFTRAAFTGDKTALAVGHDGWIVRSTDGGATWKEVAFDEQRPDPLLGVAGPFDGKLFAVGAFGLYETSTDGGVTWTNAPINIVKDEKPGVKKAAAVDPNADPFANFTAGDAQPDRHMTAMVRLADGSLLLAGEKGLLLQSADLGASWKELPSIYEGSFFGALALPDGKVLVYGMRGNAFTSADNGKTWQKSEMPLNVSLFGGTLLADKSIVLVGDNNLVLKSTDGGAHFAVASQAAHHGLAASLAEVVALPGGGLLTSGDGGVLKMASAGGAK